MRQDLTDVTVVMDRSGSMHSCQKSAEDGLNEFIQKQKNAPGKCNFTLVSFDDEYEFVHTGRDIKDIGICTLVPRGMTALHDALGAAITKTGERLRQMPFEERPALVVFFVITDGGENSSKKYAAGQIKEMIQHQENKYNWEFSYLGANQDAWAVGQTMGFKAEKTVQYATTRSRESYSLMSDKLLSSRLAVANCVAPDMSYNAAERASVVEDKTAK